MATETQLALSLIRAHYDQTEESFKNCALNLAKYYEESGKTELSEYIFAYLFPQTAFTTFDEYYYPGNILFTTNDHGRKSRCKIIAIEETGCWLKGIREGTTTATFSTWGAIERNFKKEKTNE